MSQVNPDIRAQIAQLETQKDGDMFGVTKFGPWFMHSRGLWVRLNLDHKDEEWHYYDAAMLDTDDKDAFYLGYIGDQCGPETRLKTIDLNEAFAEADQIILAERNAELT